SLLVATDPDKSGPLRAGHPLVETADVVRGSETLNVDLDLAWRVRAIDADFDSAAHQPANDRRDWKDQGGRAGDVGDEGDPGPAGCGFQHCIDDLLWVADGEGDLGLDHL